MTATNGFSQYLENAQLNWLKGTAFPAAPANLFFALFTTPPANGVTAGSVEVSGGSYARPSLVASTTIGVPSGAAPATSVSIAAVTFVSPTASWGTVTGWAVFDAVTAGNMLAYGTFPGQLVSSGDTVQCLAGSLTVTSS